jgi:hypothetical protein
MSISVSIGEKATFSVSVAAVPAPKYQWQKNGRNIAGAEQSVYTVERVDRKDAGNYRVVISNIAGKVTSRDAKLTVISPRRRVVSLVQSVKYIISGNLRHEEETN